MFKRLIHLQTKTIGLAALIVALANLTSALLGILRDRILASTFGAGDLLDVYYASFRIPDLIFNLLVIGGLSASFVPIFLEHQRESDQAKNDVHWRIASNVFNLTVSAVFLLALAAFFLMPWLVKVITPGFDPAKLALVVNLSRLMLLSPILMTANTVISGVLQSCRKFFVLSFSAIFYNLGIIIGAVFLTKFWGIYGLGAGVILGALLLDLVQLPTLAGCGFRYRAIFNFRHPAVRQIVKLMIPRTLSLGTSQLNWIVMTALASTLAAGSLSIFNLANNLQGFLVGLFGVSFATAAFPVLSEFGVRKDFPQFSKALFSSLRQTLFFVLPASIFLTVLAHPLVRFILETGSFKGAAASETAGALQFFAASIFAQATVLLLVRAFFALKNTSYPFWAALLTMAVNVVLALLLLKPLGTRGLALAFSGASFFNLALLVYFMKRMTPKGFFTGFPYVQLGKIFLSSAAAGLVSWAVVIVSGKFFDTGTAAGSLGQVFSGGLAGVAVFVAASFFVRSEEMGDAWQSVRNIFRKKTPPAINLEPPAH